MFHTHDGRPCAGAVWVPEARCTSARHRITTGQHAPRETRSLPPVLWPFEIISRFEALVRGRLHRTGRLPL